MARSAKGHSHKDADRQPPDRRKEIGEALIDDDEVVVDGFQRLSVLGLEVMTLDGPLRVRAVREQEGKVRETIPLRPLCDRGALAFAAPAPS